MLKVIITGSTGMVGRGVLLECLESPQVESVLVVNRRSLGMKHERLSEIIHENFLDLRPISDQLEGYDACFFCMGVSAFRMSEEKYTQLTFDITGEWASVLYEHNPQMVFNYVSGQGTDSTGNGNVMWARVKGRTENMVLNLGFRDAYAFRPGIILPRKGVKSSTGWYSFMYTLMRPFYPLLERMKSVTNTENVGRAMINSVLYPQPQKRLDNRDINFLAELK